MTDPFRTISHATARLHAAPTSKFYSSILVPPSTRAFRNTNANGETEIIGHPSYWRGLTNHPDVTVTDSSMPDPFSIPVIDLDTRLDLRLRVLGAIFDSAMEPAT